VGFRPGRVRAANCVKNKEWVAVQRLSTGGTTSPRSLQLPQRDRSVPLRVVVVRDGRQVGLEHGDGVEREQAPLTLGVARHLQEERDGAATFGRVRLVDSDDRDDADSKCDSVGGGSRPSCFLSAQNYAIVHPSSQAAAFTRTRRRAERDGLPFKFWDHGQLQSRTLSFEVREPRALCAACVPGLA
jgi:hypothetical protein